MYELFDLLRKKRFDEINEYESKNYSMNKNTFQYLDKILISIYGKEYLFKVKVTYPEIFFFLSKDDSNIYFSINDIYLIFDLIVNKNGDHTFLKTILELLDTKEKMKVSYSSNEYLIRGIPRTQKNGIFNFDEAAMTLEYYELLSLLLLIQEKSNYLFSKNILNVDYQDGIIRMIFALLYLKKDDPLLLKIGWKYNHDSNFFEKLSYEKLVGRQKFKYYLTQKELEDIMERNPSICQ